MKHKFLFPLLMLGLFIAPAGCSTSGTTSQQKINDSEVKNNWKLADHLRRKAGVRVMGTKGSRRVIIRGESSTANPSNQPLFIIDGQKAGHSFSNANDMLYVGEIRSVEVLPPSRAARYGMEGHYGVIIIHTNIKQ